MTYRQLRALIEEMNDTHLNDTVTIYMQEDGEFYGVFSDDLEVSIDGDPADGVLDPGHAYLVISEPT